MMRRKKKDKLSVKKSKGKTSKTPNNDIKTTDEEKAIETLPSAHYVYQINHMLSYGPLNEAEASRDDHELVCFAIIIRAGR